MKKIFIVAMTISCLFSLQNMKASFSDTTADDYIPTGAKWRPASAARQKTFAILQSNGDYQGLEELEKALAELDFQYNIIFTERLNTGGHDTFEDKRALLYQKEADLLRDAITHSQPPAYENPPAYTETEGENPPPYTETEGENPPAYSAKDEENWNKLPKYEKEDWSPDTGWVIVGDRDLAGFYDSREYNQSLDFTDEE